MSPPRPPPNPAAPSPFMSPPPEFCLPLAPTTEVLPLFAPDHLSTIQGKVAPPPPAVDNPAFQHLFVPAPHLVHPYCEAIATAIRPFHARCDPSPPPHFGVLSDLGPETRIADAAHATFRAAAIASFWDMDVYGPLELPFSAYFDHTRANWNYVSYRWANETWVPQEVNLRMSLVSLADQLDVALAVFDHSPDDEAEQMAHTLIEAEQFLHFLTQTGIRVFMHRAFHEYLERAVRILNPDLTVSQVRVLAQGYHEGRAYPTPHRSRSANPWESVHLLPQNWIDPRAGWLDDTVGWNSRDRSFDIRRFLVSLDMYAEHGEWDPEVEYEEGAIASAHFLEGKELRDLALELDEDASLVMKSPTREDEESNPRVEIVPASSSPVGAGPQVECVIEVESSESEGEDELFGSGEASVSQEDFILIPPRSPPQLESPIVVVPVQGCLQALRTNRSASTSFDGCFLLAFGPLFLPTEVPPNRVPEAR
ncbi:hypothetical protein B0H17DRAFT_1199840 [Mycena rosella]|uniref:Uncharacterized protein n=1 Tax=Mycena rosella TaxID=1033263 RepID=A0AAD7GLE2_MYCRO|nr:hypothetical protein B0H17DRAFT_1199840 [Mycena rosella]